MTDKPVRDHFHHLVNQISGISLYPQGFFVLCRDYPDKINMSTVDELSKTLDHIESYYKNTLDGLASISKILSKTGAFESWTSIKVSIETSLKDIHQLLTVIEQMNEKISASNLKADILKIAGEMRKFQEKCESACRLIDGFKDKLLSLEIYDNVYNEKGDIV